MNCCKNSVCRRAFFPRSARRARIWGGCANRSRSGPGWGGSRWWPRPRHDTASAVAAIPTANTGPQRLGLHQFGHVVAHGRRDAKRRAFRTGCWNLISPTKAALTARSCCSRTSPACGWCSSAKNPSRRADGISITPNWPAWRKRPRGRAPSLIPTTSASPIRRTCRRPSGLLPGNQPTGAGERRRVGALRLGKPGRPLRRRAGGIGGGGRQQDRSHPRGGRRLAQCHCSINWRPTVAGAGSSPARRKRRLLGNLLSQVRAAGELKSLADMRQVVRASSELQVFQPQPT